MKKTIVACFCALLVVVGASYSQPTPQFATPTAFTSLNTSRSNLTAQLEREIYAYDLNLWPNVDSNHVYITRRSYNPALGRLEDVVRTNLQTFAQSVLKTNHIGNTACFVLYPLYHSPNGTNVNLGGYGRNFTVVFQDGKPVLPFPELLAWPLSEYVPISGGAVGVERVDYSARWQDGYLMQEQTYNGYWVGCFWAEATRGDGTLYLRWNMVDSQFWNEGWFTNAEAVLHFKVAGGVYSRFNVLSPNGDKVYSTVVNLEVKKVAGSPVVSLKGWPGKQVEVQTAPSPTGPWTVRNTVTLNSGGTGQTTLSPTVQPLFTRGRLLAP